METMQADNEMMKQEIETTQSARNTNTNVPHLVVGIKQELDNEKSEENTITTGVYMKIRNVDSFNDTKIGPIKVEQPDRGEEDVGIHIKDEIYASTWSYFTDSQTDVEKMESSDMDQHSQPVGLDTVSETLPEDIRNTGGVGEGLERLLVHMRKIVKSTKDVVDNLEELPEHIHKRIHTGGKSYKCNVCGIEFNYVGEFNKHTKIHTREKLYKCDVCCKGFNYNSHLIRHQRVHTGEKPYKCDVCDKAFTCVSNMVAHKKIHTVEKPYKCDICEESFLHVYQLNAHKRIHMRKNPYMCNICEKAFTCVSHMNACCFQTLQSLLNQKRNVKLS